MTLGGPSAVLAHSGAYVSALKNAAAGGGVEGTVLCDAIANLTMWPGAEMVSLWSPNPYIDDDALETAELTCESATWGAQCMGAPCYRVQYNSTPDVFNVTCVCPVKAFDSGLQVPDTRAGICDEASTNRSCAVVTGTYWEYESYAKLSEAIVRLGDADAQPDPSTCKNDCVNCCTDCDYDDIAPPDDTAYYSQPGSYYAPQ